MDMHAAVAKKYMVSVCNEGSAVVYSKGVITTDSNINIVVEITLKPHCSHSAKQYDIKYCPIVLGIVV